MNARAAIVEDDSSGSSSSACSKLSRRVRESRIRRLQKQKGMVEGNATEIRRLRRKKEKIEEGFTTKTADQFEDDLTDIQTETENDLPVDAKSVVQSLGGSESPAFPRPVVSEDETYESYMMDNLDLQLIEVRRPIGAEYGDDESSL
jgi:hypothetical protein